MRCRLQAIAQLEAWFDQHPDAFIFKSMPGAGDLLAPGLLVKFGDHRDRFPTAGEVQALAGTCPVTVRSGKRKLVKFRQGCDREFRHFAVQFARAQVPIRLGGSLLAGDSPPLRFERSRRSHLGQSLARHPVETVAGSQTV